MRRFDLDQWVQSERAWLRRVGVAQALAGPGMLGRSRGWKAHRALPLAAAADMVLRVLMLTTLSTEPQTTIADNATSKLFYIWTSHILKPCWP